MNNLELCQQYFPNLTWTADSDDKCFRGSMEDFYYSLVVLVNSDGCSSALKHECQEMHFIWEEQITLKACLRITKRKWKRWTQLHWLAAGGSTPQPTVETLVATPNLVTLVQAFMADKAPTKAELAQRSGVDLCLVERFLTQREVSYDTVLDIFDALNIDEAIALKLQDKNHD